MEVIYAYFDDKQFVNRGFLIGPYCPIYGVGSVLIIYFLRNDLEDILSVYLKAILIAAILEYMTSFVMEKTFHARWWDYSDNKFNINGRICLETLIPFGFLACFLVYVINPFIYSCLLLVDSKILGMILGLLCIVFSIDMVISFHAIFGMRGAITQGTIDSTIMIKNKLRERIDIKRKDFDDLIREIFSRNSSIKDRLLRAFPNIHIDFEKEKENLEKKMLKRKKKLK